MWGGLRAPAPIHECTHTYEYTLYTDTPPHKYIYTHISTRTPNLYIDTHPHKYIYTHYKQTHLAQILSAVSSGCSSYKSSCVRGRWYLINACNTINLGEGHNLLSEGDVIYFFSWLTHSTRPAWGFISSRRDIRPSHLIRQAVDSKSLYMYTHIYITYM